MSHQKIQGRCPSCGSTSVRLSRRRGIEWLAPLLGLFSFRCRGCATIYFVDWQTETEVLSESRTATPVA